MLSLRLRFIRRRCVWVGLDLDAFGFPGFDGRDRFDELCVRDEGARSGPIIGDEVAPAFEEVLPDYVRSFQGIGSDFHGAIRGTERR